MFILLWRRYHHIFCDIRYTTTLTNQWIISATYALSLRRGHAASAYDISKGRGLIVICIEQPRVLFERRCITPEIYSGDPPVTASYRYLSPVFISCLELNLIVLHRGFNHFRPFINTHAYIRDLCLRKIPRVLLFYTYSEVTMLYVYIYNAGGENYNE